MSNIRKLTIEVNNGVLAITEHFPGSDEPKLWLHTLPLEKVVWPGVHCVVNNWMDRNIERAGRNKEVA